MRGILTLTLTAALVGIVGCCKTTQSFCRGPAVVANRPPCATCPPGIRQPSVFTPTPGAPLPAGPVQPGPRPPAALFDNPPGRMPATLPDVPATHAFPQPGLGQPAPNRIPPPDTSLRFDPWKPAPEQPRPAPVLPPDSVPGPGVGSFAPPRVELGTPFPSAVGPGSEFTPGTPYTGPNRVLPPDDRIRPEPLTPPPSPEPPLNIPEKNPPPDVNRRQMNAPSPIDIPGFAEAAPQVAVGQRPFADGVEWLAKQGFRTVVHLRSPETDDQAAQRQFEAKGLRYVSIVVTPQTVGRDTASELQRILAEERNRPVFIFDRDGYLVGGVWYLKLRVIDRLESAKALDEAKRLGLNPDLDAYHRAMWNAVRTAGE